MNTHTLTELFIPSCCSCLDVEDEGYQKIFVKAAAAASKQTVMILLCKELLQIPRRSLLAVTKK